MTQPKEEDFTKSIIQLAMKNPILKNTIIAAPIKSLDCDVLVYDPESVHPEGTFMCPFCPNVLKTTNQYGGQSLKYPSRILCDISRNVALCSRLLKCKDCGLILGHNELILKQAKNNQLFLLIHRSGITFRALTFIITGMIRGK